ncbi:autophagy protein Apg9-domain-containing protein [Dactylonectria macrodidyma]|uniref:Autophagy-related protein 9 n=1 Tax=Dactylonectria macrodidyma TaxID=307937 RepID=A0A9P9FAM4_9HYPO|nr:autophagy protein Apg9-domain-containing protein [Dactylonectria macrodidyma]
MTSNIFSRMAPSSRGSRSFYEQLRSRDDDGYTDDDPGLDEENLGHHFNDFDAEGLAVGDSRMTVDSTAFDIKENTRVTRQAATHTRHSTGQPSTWPAHQDDEVNNDVPASLLIEANEAENTPVPPMRSGRQSDPAHQATAGSSSARARAQWDAATTQQRLHQEDPFGAPLGPQPKPVIRGIMSGSPRERALWRWVNTSNLDSFMRDVYDYYEGGGLRCILCANALWLLETLFVAVLLTFLCQCVDYSKVPDSKSLNEIVIKQCTSDMSGLWNLGIWLYSFFFIWKSVQYFVEIRRLIYIRDFYVYLLEIPEQDMQTVSWQDIVARIMTLRDQNPKTATNISKSLRRFIGSQSKERLDAHDIANRLMRKENYLIAMINKDVLDLSLPVPFLAGRQLFSKTMEWYLHYCILDMAFNELGQVQQDFLRADRRGVLSQKLKQRLYFAGILNLIFAPVVLAYVVIVYFFTYYNEYQKDPKLAAARKYTSLAEWKFREFNELRHIFYERLHMSVPFATRYIDQFPKRMTEDIARSVAFMTGAITAILAVGSVLDSELFLNFEITKDRTVLFYLGVFGAIWAISRGMVSEETLVFNPEYALRNVIEYIHYMPDHWHDRLHSFEVKLEFAELYKMKVVIFFEEVMGIITTPMLLLFALPKCSDQIIDFFREFTIHVDGLGYVCSFAVFDFQKGVGNTGHPERQQDVREDYYSTKHGKMAASYYGFIDNYVINPKTGIPGHMPPGSRPPFHPPPAFPGLNSPTLAADMQGSYMGRVDVGRARSRAPGPARGPRAGAAIPPPSPMASMLLDQHHQPVAGNAGARSLYLSRHPRGGYRGESQIIEESLEDGGGDRRLTQEESVYEAGGVLGESTWETSPGKGLSRENSAANTEETDAGVLGLIYQLRQTQRPRRGGGMV